MELKEVTYEVLATGDKMPSGYYLKADVDAVIAKLNAENKLLKEHIANGDVSRITWIDEVIELKQKLEDVQASMYADVVDTNMENRRLKRALWLARAERAKDRAITCDYFAYLGDTEREINMTLARTWMKCRLLKPSEWSKVWRKVERKCLKKAEEYK